MDDDKRCDYAEFFTYPGNDMELELTRQLRLVRQSHGVVWKHYIKDGCPMSSKVNEIGCPCNNEYPRDCQMCMDSWIDNVYERKR